MTSVGAVVAAVTDTQTPPAPATPPDRCYAVIQSIQLGSPTTLTLLVEGSTVPVPGIKFLSSYSPFVGATVVCDRVSGDLVVMGALSGGTGGATGGPVHLGMMLPSAAVVTDPAWLLCDGSTVASHGSYPDLVALIGANLPDMRGVTPMGAGLNGIILGTRDPVGSSEIHTHTITHTHTMAHTHSHAHGPSSGGNFALSSATTTSAAGSGYLTVGGSASSTDTDASASSAGSTGASSAASTGNYPPSGGITANVPPNVGVNWYMRAL